jgi:peptidoglycan/xylan/chitin deacetylase (PgdA/CDA1 family)
MAGHVLDPTRSLAPTERSTGWPAMTGVAIVSLDCEGKWGVADHLAASGADRLTDERLRWAYRSITGALDRRSVPATFAFVELFLCPDRARQLDLTRVLAEGQPYLRPVIDALGGADEGWSAPWALDLVHRRHEIATHGFSHTPWDQLTAAQASVEIDLVPRERRRSMVFPRNRVRHADLLPRRGCLGYRAARPVASRIASFASEFNLLTASDRANGGEAVPAGVFINWLSGPRRLVPRAVTRLRARRILDHAARTGGVAHFWTHPENIATHPETLKNFNGVIDEIARAAHRGDVRPMTQLEFLLSGENGCGAT